MARGWCRCGFFSVSHRREYWAVTVFMWVCSFTAWAGAFESGRRFYDSDGCVASTKQHRNGRVWCFTLGFRVGSAAAMRAGGANLHTIETVYVNAQLCMIIVSRQFDDDKSHLFSRAVYCIVCLLACVGKGTVQYCTAVAVAKSLLHARLFCVLTLGSRRFLTNLFYLCSPARILQLCLSAPAQSADCETVKYSPYCTHVIESMKGQNYIIFFTRPPTELCLYLANYVSVQSVDCYRREGSGWEFYEGVGGTVFVAGGPRDTRHLDRLKRLLGQVGRQQG